MAVHQAVREALHAEAFEAFLQERQEALKVGSVKVDVLLVVAASEDVVQHAGHVQTKRSSHAKVAWQETRRAKFHGCRVACR